MNSSLKLLMVIHGINCQILAESNKEFQVGTFSQAAKCNV